VIGACQRCGDFVCRLCLKGKRLVCEKCNPAGDTPKPDLGVALQYVTNDPQWLSKLAPGALCLLLSIVLPLLGVVAMWALMGWGIRIAKREQNEGPQRELPTWENAGELIGLGFRFWLAQLMPVFILLFTLFFVMGAAIAIVIVAGASASSGGSGPPSAAANVAALLASLGIFGAVLVIIPLSLLLSVVMPAIHVHYLRTGRLTAGLEFRELWRLLSTRFTDYLLLWVFFFAVQLISMFVSQLTCFIGLFLCVPWAIAAQGYLAGRFAGWLDAEEGPAV
jgi:hypothetical protein